MDAQQIGPGRGQGLREGDVRHLRDLLGDERKLSHRHDVLADRRGESGMMECGELQWGGIGELAAAVGGMSAISA